MTKHMRGVHVAQVPTRAMLIVSVSIVSVLLSLLPARTANALPLGVDKLLSPVIAPLLPGTKSQPTQSNPSNSSNTSATPAASQSQGAANQSSSAASAADSGNGDVLIAENIEPLEPVAPIDTSDIKQPLLPLAYLASARRESAPVATLAHTTTVEVPPIQATEKGWILFGIAWYWWLLVVSGLAYAGRWFVLRKRQDAPASV